MNCNCYSSVPTISSTHPFFISHSSPLYYFRLILGCERIRKLLSQLPESSITVENMSDNGDVNFSLKRDDLSVMCADLLEGFKAVIRSALTSAGITAGGLDAAFYPSPTTIPHICRTILWTVAYDHSIFNVNSGTSTLHHTPLYCLALHCLSSRNIGCENFRTCFFSSFDCANISWDVITNRLDDFCPCLVRQIIVSQPYLVLPVLSYHVLVMVMLLCCPHFDLLLSSSALLTCHQLHHTHYCNAPQCIVTHSITSRNIGCENFRICFFSSFDCANISWDVITNRLDDFGPCLVRQIIVSQP